MPPRPSLKETLIWQSQGNEKASAQVGKLNNGPTVTRIGGPSFLVASDGTNKSVTAAPPFQKTETESLLSENGTVGTSQKQ